MFIFVFFVYTYLVYKTLDSVDPFRELCTSPELNTEREGDLGVRSKTLNVLKAIGKGG